MGAWAAAWIAGRCSPDDVADTLAGFADLHLVEVSAPADEPVIGDGVLGLLGVMRTARRLSVRLPGPGAPQGLPPDPATTSALVAGEVLLVDDGAPTPLALVAGEHDGSIRWRVSRYRTPVPDGAVASAGEIEYELRQAVSEATALIAGIGGARAGTARTDVRGTIRAVTHRHLVELPPHDDERATRLLATAAQVEAIVSVAAAAGTTFGDTAHHWDSGDDQLRRLRTLTHAARAAAVNRVITDFLGTTW